MSQYPAVLDAWSNINGELNNAGAMLSSHDEENYPISVGYARVNSSVVDWILVFAQSHGEVVGPIHNLRNTILASIFGVVAAIFVVSL
jgi:osomolarity two-component system, sensor histidine kinase SLN1